MEESAVMKLVIDAQMGITDVMELASELECRIISESRKPGHLSFQTRSGRTILLQLNHGKLDQGFDLPVPPEKDT